MAIWGGLLGFLAFLYVSTEVIQAWKLATFSDDEHRASMALSAHANASAALARVAGLASSAAPDRERLARDVDLVNASLAAMTQSMPHPEVRSLAAETERRLAELRGAAAAAPARASALAGVMDRHAELGKAIANAIEGIDAAQTSFIASHRQNTILITVLAIFILGLILVLEYRWLVRPIVRMAAVLRTSEHSLPDLDAYALRRDEIGAFAQALTSHFQLVRRQQEMASDEQAKLSARLLRQEGLKRESMAFQDRIADIVQRLEGHAGRMSEASGNLASISSEADARAAASVQSTQRVSSHVDLVAASIRDIAGALAAVAEDAESTSVVAAAARNLVGAARDDAKALAEAARTIEPVVALIETVANQTNLLALNATIEAARAGEMGRGFAVVAHEVKQLATRTARATEEVRSGLQGITSASARVSDRVETLVESIEKVDAVAAAIAGSMRRQDVNSQAITSNTVKTADDVREVAATVKHVAGMIGEAKQAADLVTRVSTDLGRQAADLRVAVERFVETTEEVAA